MSTSPKVKNNLPPKRTTQGIRDVKPPLHSARLSKFIYILVLLTTLLSAYYSYRVVQWKTEVGGWWNLALGKNPQKAVPSSHPTNQRHESVEDRINGLAEALGMPPKDLARAIAGAVKEYVPPASLSSIRERETAGPAVDVLLGDTEAPNTGSAPAATPTAGGVMDSFVGFDEP